MKIDDYFISIDRSLSQNLQISPEDRLAPADQPNLSQIFAEIEGFLGKKTE